MKVEIEIPDLEDIYCAYEEEYLRTKDFKKIIVLLLNYQCYL